MRCPPKTKAGRLLRVLFLRVGSVPVGPTAHRTGKAMTPRRFPAPWSAEVQPNNTSCATPTDSNWLTSTTRTSPASDRRPSSVLVGALMAELLVGAVIREDHRACPDRFPSLGLVNDSSCPAGVVLNSAV